MMKMRSAVTGCSRTQLGAKPGALSLPVSAIAQAFRSATKTMMLTRITKQIAA